MSLSSAMNNGFSTGYFKLNRGVRQGDPLSPYLFIICLETLAIQIGENQEINGIKIGKNDIKLVAFADDLTCFVKNKQSYNALTRLLDDFGIFSGLKKNRDKTEVFRLGQNANEGLAEKLEIQEIKATVKILGIHFTYNENMFRKLNFESMIKSIKQCLNSWNWRGLTLIGKVQVIKAFAVPKILRKDLLALKFDQNYFYLEIEKEKVYISKVKSRYIYKTFLSKKATKPTAVSRYEKLYNTETFKLDWKKNFLIPYKTTLYTKLREFQFKILNKILYTNDLLSKIGKVKSPLCDFCQIDLETTEHLLFHCHFVKRFWNEMYVLLKAKNVLSKPLKIEEVIFGICEDKPNVLPANLINLNGKCYIYNSKLNNSPLSCKSFIQRTKTIYYTESIVAKENKQLVCHNKKWEKFIPFVQDV